MTDETLPSIEEDLDHLRELLDKADQLAPKEMEHMILGPMFWPERNAFLRRILEWAETRKWT